jgi:hypothetical protein
VRACGKKTKLENSKGQLGRSASTWNGPNLGWGGGGGEGRREEEGGREKIWKEGRKEGENKERRKGKEGRTGGRMERGRGYL